MAETIEAVASMASTSYYGGLRPANGPLRLQHFIWLCGAADSKIKQTEYNTQLNNNMRQRLTNAAIVMSGDNYSTVTVKVKDEKAKLPCKVMTFSGDRSGLGVESVKPSKKCKEFVRLRSDEVGQVCHIKDVVFWWVNGDVIEFINLNDTCSISEVTVRYIAELNKKSIVQESRKWDILNMVTAFIKAAKEGTVIDMSNDGNANVTQQTEINKYILKALQQR